VLSNDGGGITIDGEDLAPLTDLVLTPAGDFHIDLGYGYDGTLDLSLANKNTTLPAEWEMRFDGFRGFPPDWFQPEIREGRLEPGQTTDIPCQIKHTTFLGDLDPGTYSFQFVIVPPRTLPENVPDDAWRTVELTIAEPAFSTDPTILNLECLVTTNPDPARIHITPTEGTGPIENATLETDEPWLSAAFDPDDPGTIIVTAETKDLDAQSLSGHLTIKTSDTILSVPVSVRINQPSVQKLMSDPIRNVVYGLSSQYSAEGYVGVFEPTTTETLKIIPVGNKPVDLAFNPDGSAIYVSSDANWEICRIDPESREVTATIPVPEAALPPLDHYRLYPRSSLAAGSQGRIFYTKGGNILAIDFQTGQVLDTFEISDLPEDLVEPTKGFTNLLFDARENRIYFTRNADWFGALRGRIPGVRGRHQFLPL